MGKKLRLVGGPEREVQKPRVLGHSSAIGLRILVLLVLVMGAVAGCGSEESRARPPHMGAFLRVEGRFIEMTPVKGRSFDANVLPVFEGGRPTIWLWHEGVNLNLLNLREQTVREPIPYHVTRTEEGIYILEVTEDLGPGTYCLVQGDPFLLSDMLSRWCFRVEGSQATSPTQERGSNVAERTGPAVSPSPTPSVDPDLLARPPDDGLYLVVDGEPVELHDLLFSDIDWPLPAFLNDEFFDEVSALGLRIPVSISDFFFDGIEAVRKRPVLLLQSNRVSPADVRVYHARDGIGVRFSEADSQCGITALSEVCGAGAAGRGLGLDPWNTEWSYLLGVDGQQVSDCDQAIALLQQGSLWDSHVLTVLKGTTDVDIAVSRDCILGVDKVETAFELDDGYARITFPAPVEDGLYFVEALLGRGEGYAANAFLILTNLWLDIRDIAYQPDSDLLAVASDLGVSLYDTNAHQEVGFLRAGPVNAIAFSPDGDMLASGSSWDETVGLWRVADGTLLRGEDYESPVKSVAFSPDGEMLAIASEDDRIVQLWRVADGTLLRWLEVSGSEAYNVAFSPDGEMLAVVVAVWEHDEGGDNTVKLWRVADGTLVRSLEGYESDVTNVAFSPSGEMLAIPLEDDAIVELRRTADGTLLRSLESHDWVGEAAFSPDGEVLAVGVWGGTVELWRVADGVLLRTLEGRGQVTSIAFSPDGETLASGSEDATVRLWRVADGTLLSTITPSGHHVHSAITPQP